MRAAPSSASSPYLERKDIGMDSFKEDVRLARAGDTGAFARLYEKVYKDMYRTALAGLRGSQDAQDAVSEAVLDAFGSMKKLRDIEAFRIWIFRILSTKIKKKQREYSMPQNVDVFEHEEMVSAQTDIYSVEVNEALGKLSGEERLVISLCAVGGYTSEQIAGITGQKASTVRSRLSRARTKLCAELFPNEI